MEALNSSQGGEEVLEMKAVLVNEFGGPETLVYTDVATPTVGPDEVLIQVAWTSVNFADIKSRYGKKGAKVPFIPGLDAAGIVVEVGSEVKNIKVGERVAAFPKNGSYAEFVVVKEVLTFPIPDNLGFESAAACPTVSFLSYKLLADIGRLTLGETVLIHSAAGGVGTTAIQMAKILGAGYVIGTVGNRAKIPAALEAGADQVICYEEDDFAEKVNEWTNGEGADIILDSLSGWVSEKSLQCLAPYGRLVHFGNSSGGVGHFETKDLHASCRSILGFSLGTTRKKRPETLKDTADKVLSYIAAGRLSIKIGHQFELKDAKRAHELVESRQSTGKVLLKVNP
jgi:NADPH:quinone reductase